MDVSHTFLDIQTNFRRYFFELKDLLLNLEPPEVVIYHPPTPLLDWYLSHNDPIHPRREPNFNYIRDCHKPKLITELEKVSGTLAHRYWLVAGVNYVLEMAKVVCDGEEFDEYRTKWERIGREMMAYIYGLHDNDFYFEEPESCPICLDTIYDPQETLCGHTFCFKCYLAWRKENDACPLCRQDMD